MFLEDLDIGDVVYAAKPIVNDGSIPDSTEGQILAETGTRGVITKIGHLEEDATRIIWLVRFEDKDRNLGNPIGCLAEDLVVEDKREEIIS
jgi:nitrogen fixation protein NifZ